MLTARRMTHGLTLSAGKNLRTTAAGLAQGGQTPARFWLYQDRPEWRHLYSGAKTTLRRFPTFGSCGGLRTMGPAIELRQY